jgi:small-conductance mechanosensitive channel
MAEKAVVTSAEAIEAFRSSLVVYVSKARPALEEVSADVMRMRQWLEDDMRRHWEKEIRRRTKILEEAQQELFSARLSNLRQETAALQFSYRRARNALDEANEKLRLVKRWIRDFDGAVQPLAKQMEKLHTYLSHDLLKAVAFLNQISITLAQYAEIIPSVSAAVGGAPAGTGDTISPSVNETKEPKA